MGFLKKLSSLFAGGGGREDNGNIHWEYVQCKRCGERLPVRVDLRNELTPTYEEGEGAYLVHKGVMGSGKTRCFQMIEVDLYFDANRQFVSRYVTGGEFVTRKEFEAEEGEGGGER